MAPLPDVAATVREGSMPLPQLLAALDLAKLVAHLSESKLVAA
jgi:hypothetical protein